MAFSFDEIRNLLRQAIKKAFAMEDEYVYIFDMWETEVVYELGDETFKVGYSIDENGNVTFNGEPVKVVPQTIYKTAESLRGLFRNITLTLSKRSVRESLPQIKGFISRYTEKAIEGDFGGHVDELYREATRLLDWLTEQPLARTEESGKFPIEAYAYTPNAKDPDSWRCLMWESMDKGATKGQLKRAAAMTSPGGYQGDTGNIPVEEMASVRRAIRSECRRIGILERDIPKWAKEEDEMKQRMQESDGLICQIIAEDISDAELAKGIIPVRVIQKGFNTSKTRYYTDQAVADAAVIFEGAKMFANHPTKTEEREQPERSIWNWVAVVKNINVVESGGIKAAVGEAHIHNGDMKEMVYNLNKQGNLTQLGVSINAIGRGTKQTVEEVRTFVVEGLIASPLQSVDFVTEPGAGGRAGLRESVPEGFMDAELISLANLKEARPDLVEEIEAGVLEQIKREAKRTMDMEAQVKELTEKVDALTKENAELKEKLESQEKEKAKEAAQATIKEAIDKADLPEAMKQRLSERFANAETAEGIEEAINADAALYSQLTQSGKVKGMNSRPNAKVTESNVDPTEGPDDADLTESFKALGLNESAAAIAANGR